MSKAVARFKKFHGRQPDKITHVDFPAPKALVLLGKALAVEYESDKLLRGVRKKRAYRHKIGAGVSVYAHPDGKWIFIHGGKFRVTDWMRG